jgi:ABC-type multidrug transport system ATPase subunit
MLGSINAGSRTVVMTTHNLERGLELGDSIVILDRGKIVYQTPRGELSTASFQHIYDRYTEISK